MRATGPTNNETRKLIVGLEKLGRKGKSGIWKTVAKALAKPRRNRASINLWRLNKLARKFPSKTFVIPGKVLGKGEVSEKISIAALEYSKSAKDKIQAAKGSAMMLTDMLTEKTGKGSLQLIR